MQKRSNRALLCFLCYNTRMSLVESLQLPLGSSLIPFNLPGTDGNMYSTDNFSDCKILVIMFTCNHCPYAQAAEPFIIDLAKSSQDRGVQFVAINPNDADSYPDDSMDMMKLRANEKKYPFPYLQDATQAVAKAYQAQCTPDIYVFDQDHKLAYHGRVNNVKQTGDVVETLDLHDALEALLVNALPDPEQKPSIGCSIKWKI